jgi:mRNA interferase MazF
LASLGAGRQGEPGKNRPAIIVSADRIHSESDELIVIVPLSRSRSASALRPRVDPETGIDHSSAAICPAVRGVSRTRLLHRLGEVGAEKMSEIEEALGSVLGIPRRS